MKNIFIFLLGAGLGSVVTWKVLDKYYKNLSDQEIESVKETFKKRLVEINEKDKADDKNEEIKNNNAIEEINKNNKTLESIINSNRYAVGIDTGDDIPEKENDEDDSDYIVDVENGPDASVPYIISENEFGEFGNEEKSLIYYNDFILADENDDVITDPESLIGDALGEFVRDPMIERVYVRDEVNEIDYIILRSEKSYRKDVVGEEEEQ